MMARRFLSGSIGRLLGSGGAGGGGGAAGPTVTARRSFVSQVPGSGEKTVTIQMSGADTLGNFTVSAIIEQNVTGEGLRVRRIERTNSGSPPTVTVNIVNNSLTAADGTLHLIAVDD